MRLLHNSKYVSYKVREAQICQNDCDSAFCERFFFFDWNEHYHVEDDTDKRQRHFHEDEPKNSQSQSG